MSTQTHRLDRDPEPTEHLRPTRFLDCEDPRVRAFATDAVAGARTEAQRVAQLFIAVRDEIRYDPYSVSRSPESHTASGVLQRGHGYCIPKAVLLSAAARAIGIPARLGFADVRNHLQSQRLAAAMGGSDTFVFHGYSELFVGGEWRKATPAFNAALCERFGVAPLQFDGCADALLHPFTGDGSGFMEYVRDRGSYGELPFDEILSTLDLAYPGMIERLARMRDPVFDR